MGLRLCPQPQLGPAAFILVQDVSIRRSHESKVGYGFYPKNSLVLASWKIVSSWKCRCGIGGEVCSES